MSNGNGNPPSIAFFTSSMGDGGAQRTIANLARGFVEFGYAVDLLLISAEGPYLDTLPSGINVIDLNGDRALTAIPSLISYLRESVPDVIFSTMEHLNVVSLLAAELSRTGTKTAVRVANIRTKNNNLSVKDRIQYLLARRLYSEVNFIFALSEDVKIEATDYYGLITESISVISNPVTVADIQQRAIEKPLPELLETDSEIFLSVGRLSEQKDMSTTIQAFSRLTESRDVELIILGKGHKEQELKELTAALDLTKQVHFLGFVDNPFIYMDAADVFVLSSRWEGFGHVIVESMACGTPVVATDCPGGPSEILKNGEYGELVPVGDDSALAAAIERTLESPPDPSLLIERAMEFDYERITRQYEERLFGGE